MFRVTRLTEMFGFGLYLSRSDFHEYAWWEFEFHVTFIVWYVTVTVNRHV